MILMIHIYIYIVLVCVRTFMSFVVLHLMINKLMLPISASIGKFEKKVSYKHLYKENELSRFVDILVGKEAFISPHYTIEKE